MIRSIVCSSATVSSLQWRRGHVSLLSSARHHRSSRPEKHGLCVEAKRSDKKKSARRRERRDDMRAFQEQRLENARTAEAAAAAVKQRQVPPPKSMDEATQRISDSEDRINFVAIQLKELKQEARDSEDFSQEMGFKVFPEVQEAMRELQRCKASAAEARIEAALFQLGNLTGKPRHLDSFNWSFGADLSENLECCGYILNNCAKFQAVEPGREVLQVLQSHGIEDKVDPKATSWLLTPAATVAPEDDAPQPTPTPQE